MKALVCREFGLPQDVVALQEVNQNHQIGVDDVLIEVQYATVSHATGLLIEGRYQKTPPLPFVPGTEGVGKVLSSGSNVAHVKPGDPVAFICDWGAYGEQLVVQGATVYAIAPGLDALQALAVPISYGTAYSALHWRAQLQEGDTILVLGAGSGVGAAAVELARLVRGVTVIGCASSAQKRQATLQKGAHHAVDSDGLIAQVKQLTQGRGVDIVFDPVGGDLLLQALRCTAQNGKVVSIGFASGTIPQIPMNILLVKNLTVFGFFYGQYIGWTPADERVKYAPQMRDMIAELFALAQRRAIHPAISQVYPMDQICQALSALHGRNVVGKIALEIKGDTR